MTTPAAPPALAAAAPLLALAAAWDTQGRPAADVSEAANVLVACAAELRALLDQHTAPEPSIVLLGNLSDGFEAFGPYPTLDDALTATDASSFFNGWAMTLAPATTPSPATDAATSTAPCDTSP